MGGTFDNVIPARFLVTLGHFIAILLVPKSKDDNVYAGLATDPTNAQLDDAKSEVNVSRQPKDMSSLHRLAAHSL